MFVRRIILMGAAFGAFGLCGKQLEAQERAARPADSVLVMRNTLKRLFADIQLSKQQEAEAERVIRTSYYEKRQHLRQSDPKAYAQLQALDRARDSLLLRILTDSSQRAQFRRNAEAP